MVIGGEYVMVSIEEVKKRIYNTTASNKNALYDSHIYWSQKPYNICDILIDSFSEEGDVVFDPFLGSGVTLLQALSNNNKRKAIGCEINEAPLFIVKTLLKNYDPKTYKTISNDFLSKIRELQKYYYTECENCKANGVITSVIFDKASRTSDIVIKNINYRCACSQKCTKKALKDDMLSINIDHKLKNIEDTLLIPNSKLAVYENQHINQIFTKRNFAILDEIVGIINNLDCYNDLFKYILMSVIHLCKITDKHSNSQWPLWIPKTDCVEKNIIDVLEKKVKKFATTISFLNETYKDKPEYKLLHKGSQHITSDDIANESVQLIITDPPYLGQVAYSEYMQLYKPFLGLNFNIDDEIVVSSAPSRNKDETEYFYLLDQVFEICSDKLKNEGYFCMYFHDSSLEVWNRLITSLSNHHLQYLGQAHVAKSNTLKNIISPKKSLNGDCILFFRKTQAPIFRQNGTESVEEIEKNIVRQAHFLVRKSGSLSTPELYDKGLMEILIQNGWLRTISQKYKSLVDIFEKHLKWDADIAKWTL